MIILLATITQGCDVMTIINVRSHARAKPDRSRNDPLRDQIEARKLVLAAKMKAREDWPGPGWNAPRAFRSVASFLRDMWRG